MLFLRTLAALLFTSLLFCAICSAQVITPSQVNVKLSALDSRAAVVTAGTSQQIAFTADPTAAGGDLFHVVSSIPGATVSLILPSGTEITAANAVSLGYSYDVLENDEDPREVLSLLGAVGTHTLIELPAQSVAGTYSLKIVAPAGPEDTAVIASYISSSAVRTGLVTQSSWYRIGQTVVFSALVFDGETPVNNATVTVSVDDKLDDTTLPVTVTLQDSGTYDNATGDGIYTGTFTPTRTGDYSAALKVTGTAAGNVNFSRVASTTFSVNEALATFASFGDTAVDDDSDGVFERLVIGSNLSVQKAGTYQFSVTLQASNGKTIKSESFATLATGTQQMSATFSAATVLELGVDGPYAIKDALLTFHSDPDTAVADYRAAAGNTAAYPLPALNPSPLFFTSNRTAEGVDLNGNGKYDLLRVRAQVVARRPGSYEWSGTLVDSAGAEITFVSSSGVLVAGANFITFDFDGSAIGQHGVNGPYSVRSVILFGEGVSAIVDQLLDTAAFSFKEFENSDNVRLGTITAQEASGDGDGFIEPGELGSLSLQLQNAGGSNLTGISTTLSSSTPGVTITSATSTYPNIPASGNGTNITPFTFVVPGTIVCGEIVRFTLTIHHDGDGGNPSVVNFSIQTGRPAAPTSISYTGAPVAIPDEEPAGVNIPLTVSGFSGRIQDLNFRFGGSSCTAAAGATTVGLDHTYVGDLVITLTSPRGTTVTLMNLPGPFSSGNNFCNTILDDEGSTSSIQFILPDGEPYSGTFRPASPLAAFRGEDPNGTWILNVADLVGTDTGNVRDFSLVLTGFQCGSDSTALLTDDFNDNSVDTAKWTAGNLFSGFTDTSLPLAETNQKLEVGPLLLNTGSSHYNGLRTVNTYNFTGAYSHVELVQAASTSTGGDAMFTIGNNVDNYYRIYENGGNLFGLKKIGGVKTTLFTISYNSTNHRFLRIRHNATTNSVVLETAPTTGSGPGTWTQQFTEPWDASVQLSSMIFEIKGGTFQSESNAPGKVIFDNFEYGLNSPPSTSPTVVSLCPGTGTINGGTAVTIDGTAFQNGATVRFGGVSATNVEVLSSTTISATTPAHAAGAVDVSVTNPNGQNGTLNNGFTYASIPANVLLADDFNDNCLNTSAWTASDLFSGFIDLGVPLSETSHELEIGPLLLNASGSHYRGIRSVNSYDFTGASAYVELVQPADQAGTADAMFTVGGNVDHYYRIFVNGGSLLGHRKVAGVRTTIFQLPYDPVNHRYLRIRHDATTNSVVFETAPSSGSGPGTWTVRYTEAWNSSIPLATTLFELKGGTWQPETNAPGKVVFDNFLASH
ncbi:MAG TPA: proprotein convertase P-domain-containing protein [Pyrinomonadaceae bacterium]|nr:proprotein convertase P-domain-containing protein [Pyrinomonadaceae bacterium]